MIAHTSSIKMKKIEKKKKMKKKKKANQLQFLSENPLQPHTQVLELFRLQEKIVSLDHALIQTIWTSLDDRRHIQAGLCSEDGLTTILVE